ncbi:MAG: type I-C CRISPR-associated protein Cas7/Csd2 [Omnitrophica bacterium GWA2_52_12]|nr:MAG: type I-C CRISPR-associated protein Cas7/Csd2 [Omnitrophica bacterium GWA2_52_12]
MKPIENRYEFVYLFDVENGNPNGDPDAGNMPRIDPETSYGIVTDVCLKRKIRNFTLIAKEEKSPYKIYVKEKAVLTLIQKQAYEDLTDPALEKEEQIVKARAWMCQNFFDVRTFGAVMSLKEFNCGQVRGPVQINFARSIEPVAARELTITRMAVATEKEAKDQTGDNRTMGRKHVVPYALYRAEGYVSAHLANQTGFSQEDLELLWSSLVNMFEHDHSAARGKMAARKLVIFKHDTALGNAPSHKLFDCVKVTRATDAKNPPRAFSDYKVDVGCEGIKGVTIDKDRI